MLSRGRQQSARAGIVSFPFEPEKDLCKLRRRALEDIDNGKSRQSITHGASQGA
jgi:hypothetical protein